MAPRYAARDGYPSMFELEDIPGSTGATKRHQTTTSMTLHPRHDARTAEGAKSEAWAQAEVPGARSLSRGAGAEDSAPLIECYGCNAIPTG
jgi:hypothetical protein